MKRSDVKPATNEQIEAWDKWHGYYPHAQVPVADCLSLLARCNDLIGEVRSAAKEVRQQAHEDTPDRGALYEIADSLDAAGWGPDGRRKP